MIRSFLCAAALFSLAACNTTGGVAVPGSPPANTGTPPLSQTQIDDKAIRLLFDTLETTTTLIDGAIAVGKIKVGSPKALRIERGLAAVQIALNAASSAQRRSEQGNYVAALAEATVAFTAVRDALKEQ